MLRLRSLQLKTRNLSGINGESKPSDSSIRSSLEQLGQTRIKDMAQTKKHISNISRGLWARYVDRYFVRGGGSFMPIFHAALAIGILGYTWEYSHLSKIDF